MKRVPFRQFTLAKDNEQPEQNQDACGFDDRQGAAVISDGVASAIFSRSWARVLVRAVLTDPPNPEDRLAMGQWLAERRALWRQGIDPSTLAWNQKAKLGDGAFATLLWVRLEPPQADGDGLWRLRGHAIGDSCLFLFRRGSLVCKTPIQHSSELEAPPIVVGSVDLNRDHMLLFQPIDQWCEPDDLVVLTTDAIADWALRQEEAGKPLDWERYWTIGQDEWVDEINRLRGEREMRYDDATLLLFRVRLDEMADEPEPKQSEPPPRAADPAEETPAVAAAEQTPASEPEPACEELAAPERMEPDETPPEESPLQHFALGMKGLWNKLRKQVADVPGKVGKLKDKTVRRLRGEKEEE